MKTDKIYLPQIFQLRLFLLKKFIAEPTITSGKNSRWAILVLLRVLLLAPLQRTKKNIQSTSGTALNFLPSWHYPVKLRLCLPVYCCETMNKLLYWAWYLAIQEFVLLHFSIKSNRVDTRESMFRPAPICSFFVLWNQLDSRRASCVLLFLL